MYPSFTSLVITFGLAICSLPGQSKGAVLDPVPPELTETDRLLVRLEKSLELGGVDIRFGVGDANNEKRLIDRFQLTYLENLPVPKENAAVQEHYFAHLFGESVVSTLMGEEPVLLALNNARRTSTQDVAEFTRMWEMTEPRKRVFVSFASQDLQAAEQVRAQLIEAGYTVFLYRAQTDGRTFATSVDVGRFFAEAGIFLAIDSLYARSSPGTQVERLVLERYRDPSQESIRGETRLMPVAQRGAAERSGLVEAFEVIAEAPVAGRTDCCRICRRVSNSSGPTGLRGLATRCIELLQSFSQGAISAVRAGLKCSATRCGEHCSNAQ